MIYIFEFRNVNDITPLKLIWECVNCSLQRNNIKKIFWLPRNRFHNIQQNKISTKLELNQINII